jgi:hypothetical protein
MSETRGVRYGVALCQAEQADDTGLTVKYNFNCIIITPKGIFPVELKSADPLAAAKAGDTKGQAATEGTGLVVPNPPVQVGA